MCKQLFDVVFWASESMDEPVSMEEEEPEAFECPKGHPAKRWDDPGTLPQMRGYHAQGEEIMLWD